MHRHWIVVVVVGVLALAMTAPAWAAPCKVQAALTGNHFGTGVAEKKVQAATLKAAAVNKFEVDVTGAGKNVIYAVMVSTNTTGTFPAGFTTVGAFMTDALGAGEFDLKNSTFTCDIQRVAVVSFSGAANTLTAKFGVLVNDDPPEVQNEIQLEIENEVHNLIQNEIQLEPQPNNP
jgi:hypothetical protein